MYNEYWETDEFEDLVARSLIGLHETKVKKTKKVPKCIRFDGEVFKKLKSWGCYFCPGDRNFIEAFNPNVNKVAATQYIDILNDGIPNRACLAISNDSHPDNKVDDAYLTTFYLEKIPFLPKPFSSDSQGVFFRCTQVFFQHNHISGDGTYLVLEKDGTLRSCYIKDFYSDPVSKRPVHIKHRPMLLKDNGKFEDYYSAWGSMTLQIYQDRQYLWNVQAQEGIAKATFGVYPEQIQSLFYARDLPQTETGRKRPILHWVNSHQRRMKSGIDVDIEKYLRGTHEFIMNGTKFKITNPLKQK